MLVLSACAVALAAAGVAFGYWVLLPRAVHFLTNYDNAQFHQLIRASSYYSFVVTVLVGVVLVFQTPLVVLGLVSLGVLSSRTLRKHRRMGYLITAAIALALPGPDPVTTFLELLPMWLLFEASIWLAVSSSGAGREPLLPRLPWAADGQGSGQGEAAGEGEGASRRRRARRGRRRHSGGGNPNQDLFFVRLRRHQQWVSRRARGRLRG